MLMCTKVCRVIFFDYVIEPSEADSQIDRRHNQSASSSLVLCRDSDELTCDNKNEVPIDIYLKETWRHVNMIIPMTDQVKNEFPIHA